MPYNSEGVGYADTDTSEAAAEQVDASTIRGMVLRLLKRDDCPPLTADEISLAIDIPGCSVRPRLSELRDSGHVVDSGERRNGNYGKLMICWMAKKPEDRP